MSPQLTRTHQILDLFFGWHVLDRIRSDSYPFSQGGTLDAVLKVTCEGVTALVQGMHEMRASAVTRQTLTELYELQLQEMQIYVQAETAPLHRSIKTKKQNLSCVSQAVIPPRGQNRTIQRVDALRSSGSAAPPQLPLWTGS